jgi:hypothetical protein
MRFVSSGKKRTAVLCQDIIGMETSIMTKTKFFSLLATLSLISAIVMFSGCEQATDSSSDSDSSTSSTTAATTTTTTTTAVAGSWVSTSSGTLVLASDGTFSYKIGTTTAFTGTFTCTSTTITFVSVYLNQTCTITGTSSGSTLSLVDNGTTIVYTKE